MRVKTPKEIKIHQALRASLTRRGLTSNDVAQLIGIKPQSARQAISLGQFSEERAAEWSAILGIPMEVFTEGIEESDTGGELGQINRVGGQLGQIKRELEAVKDDIRNLREEVQELTRWKEIVTGRAREE